MRRTRLSSKLCKRAIAFLAVFGLALFAMVGHAAYRIARPVAQVDEPINQGYLYGRGVAVHKGVDWSAADLGDAIYAVASGTVVQVQEDHPNNCHPSLPPPNWCPAWGNYVLIQHDKYHYDRTEGQQLAYVYSLSLHLRNGNVFVDENDHVNAGQLIAHADNTGNSTGDHLHLQVVVHPYAQREIEPVNTLESEFRSRNPELWLDPYPGTGTVVGKVTNFDGTPAGGLYVLNLEKQAGWGYQSSYTYNDPALNPDDILVENWATTDVLPGDYHVTLSNGSDMGWHEVVAGQVTYVGLFPVYLPEFRSGTTWDSTIVIRNNSDSYATQAITTFFSFAGTVWEQETDTIPPRGFAIVNPSGNMSGAALVVASEEVSVVVLTDNGNKAYAYSGVPSTLAGPPSVSGVETAAEVFVPCFLINYYGWSSYLYVQNAGARETTVHGDFYNDSGTKVDDWSGLVQPGGRAYLVFTGANKGSVHLWAEPDQPLAAVVRHDHDEMAMAYPGSSSGDAMGHLPSLFKDYYGWYSSYQLQEVTNNAAWFRVTYYPSYAYSLLPLYGRGHKEEWMGNVPGLPPSGWNGAGRMLRVSGYGEGQATTAIHHSTTTQALGYHGFKAGSRDLYMPHIKKNVDYWISSLTVQNVGSASTRVTVRFYSQNGGTVQTVAFDLYAGYSRELYSELPNGVTSAWIHSDTSDVVAAVHETYTVQPERSMGYSAVPR